LPQPGPSWRFSPIGVRAFAHTATLLADGRVLLAGGFASEFWMNRVTETDVYDPATGLWSVAAPTSAARGYHTATLLRDGRVMVTGGDWRECDGGVGCLAGLLMTTEIYDPRIDAWSEGPPLATPHVSYTATLLRDGALLLAGGSVLVVGGCDDVMACNPSSSAEIYRPAYGSTP